MPRWSLHPRRRLRGHDSKVWFSRMALHTVLLLFLAGIAGGMLTALVGGAAIVTYPALIAAGTPPLPATTCNLTAAVPGALLAALSDRKQLPPFDRAFSA